MPQQAFKNETFGLPNERGNLVVESMTNSTAAWPKLLPLTLDTAQTPGLRTAADRNLFAYYIDKVLPVMARPYVHTDYERFSYQLTVALHEPILMDVLLASAATHLSAGNSDKQFQALKYYSSAVNKLRQKMAGSEIDGTEDWLVFVAMALCLFEVCPLESLRALAAMTCFDKFNSVGILLANPELAYTSSALFRFSNYASLNPRQQGVTTISNLTDALRRPLFTTSPYCRSLKGHI